MSYTIERTSYYRFVLPLAQQPNSGLRRRILEVWWSQRHTTLGRTPLDEGSARRRDIYLTTHNTLKRQTFMPSETFEPAQYQQ